MSGQIDNPRVGCSLRYANVGQRVWAPYSGTQYALCTVVVSAGHQVKVENKKRRFEAWRDVRTCFEFVPEEP